MRRDAQTAIQVTSGEGKFFSIDRLTRCWIWSGRVNHGGYGRVSILGTSKMAHRVFFEFYKGKIPAGLVLDHLCRNPRCVNPNHLEAVTNRENILRGTGWAGRNAAKTSCKHGHGFTESNTYVYNRDGNAPGRVCRECCAARARARRSRRRTTCVSRTPAQEAAEGYGMAVDPSILAAVDGPPSDDRHRTLPAVGSTEDRRSCGKCGGAKIQLDCQP